MDHYYSYSYNAHSDNTSVSNNAQKKKKKKPTKVKSGGAVSAPVKLSTDPQSVAARERRHRISERFKTLQGLVPGGAKLDTVSMLDEAIHYVKFLKTQIWLHESLISAGSGSADAHSDSFHPHMELYWPQTTTEWSQCSADDATFGAGQYNSWAHDMAQVQFGNATTTRYKSY